MNTAIRLTAAALLLLLLIAGACQKQAIAGCALHHTGEMSVAVAIAPELTL